MRRIHPPPSSVHSDVCGREARCRPPARLVRVDYWQDLLAAFGLHQRLTEAMEDNYAALERLRPGTVRWLDAESEVPGLTVVDTL